MQTAFLSLKGVKKAFPEGNREIAVLQDITVSFEQGKTYAISGVSGTGKSTLMYLMAGLDQPTSGSVYFNKKSVNSMTPCEHEHFLQRDVGLLFQQPYLLKELSVIENLILAASIAGTSESLVKERAEHLLSQVGLSDKKNAQPGALSGGQQARLALARALINRPAFLIADEPTGNLDEKTGKEIISLLLTLQKEWGMGLIISTHDEYVAEKMQHRYRLHDGHLEKITE